MFRVHLVNGRPVRGDLLESRVVITWLGSHILLGRGSHVTAWSRMSPTRCRPSPAIFWLGGVPIVGVTALSSP